jgi:hypothetical protein
MVTCKQIAARLTLSTALGLALMSGIGSAPARADDTDNKPKQNLAGWDPMSVGYPLAAPGLIGNYHWTDYTQTEWKSGSAADARYYRDQEITRQVYEQAGKYPSPSPSTNDPWAWHEPNPVDYPTATPGNIGLWHWTDYTHTAIAYESASAARLAMEREIAAKQWESSQAMYHRSDDPYYHSWGWIDPMPLSYPMAPPGTLGLWHYTDYTRYEMQPESATEARQDNQQQANPQQANPQSQDQKNQSPSNK